jgi:hypothetical protein
MPKPLPRPAPPKISREHVEFITRLKECCKCKAREAGRYYVFISPGVWMCKVCEDKEREQCKDDTAQQSD